MAQRIRHLTTNQGIAGSSPARVKNFFNVYVTKTLKTTILFPLFTLLHSWEVAWKLLKSYCDVDSTNYHVTTAKVVTIYLYIEVNSQIIHVSKISPYCKTWTYHPHIQNVTLYPLRYAVLAVKHVSNTNGSLGRLYWGSRVVSSLLSLVRYKSNTRSKCVLGKVWLII